jgi:aspartyl-tRNA(Asn)/glutamyl-tRNA(Gln) amidotransferase subunit A
MTIAELPGLTIVELQRLLRGGEIAPCEILQALHEWIENVEPQIAAYLSRDLDAAIADAENADVNLSLGGIPLAIKDVISVEDQPCTCGSKILHNYRALYDATAIARLKTAGAIPFGKTNLDEFAMGSSTENSSTGPSRNPWDLTRIPGGSSGGSTAAVAAGAAIAALGSDTGGSIRQPAALCSVVGLKPTYGRVSRYGLTAFASSLDQIGPIAKTVRDAALLLQVMAGLDANDSTTLDAPVPDYVAQLETELRGVRLGLPKEYLVEGIDPEVRAAIEAAVAHLSSLGAQIIEISLPHSSYAIDTYYIIASAEASTNLARFDGVRYGYRAENPKNLLDHYGRTRAEGFGAEVKRRIILGTYVLSSGYHDAFYLRAQKVRTLIRQDFIQAFEQVNALISPTTPEPAFKIGERANDPLRMYLADIFTIAANLAGICGISIPCGFASTPEGTRLPIGLQILGKPLDELRILQIAHAYEQSTAWHLRRPPL